MTDRMTLPVATTSAVRTRILRALRPRGGRVAVLALLFLTSSALGLVVPLAFGRIVDAVVAASPEAMLTWVLLLAAGAVGAAGVVLVARRLLVSLVQDVLAELREDVVVAAMRLPAATVDDVDSADLVSRVTGDVESVSDAGTEVLPTILGAGFAVVVSAAGLALLHPLLALAGAAAVPCYVIGARAFMRRTTVVYREVREREADRSQAVIETVRGRETLIALGDEQAALDGIAERAEAAIQAQMRGVRLRNRLFRWINGGELLGLGLILGTGFALTTAGAITVGGVTAAALVFHRLFGPIGSLIFSLDDIQRASVGLARLVGVIDATPPAADGVRPSAADVVLDDVHFAYDTTGHGLRGVSLTIAAGEVTAFVGASGSGKSTAARLVAGHLRPHSGRVLVGGADPADLTDGAPYVIAQDVHRFAVPIADELRLVAPAASDDDLVSALRAAGADWAVPDLYAEPGDDHHEEGRTQHLAVARAMLADPAVVVLDEATADVGLVERDGVDAAIAALARGRTALVIAHRLSQVHGADRIVVFDDGRIAEQGTHDQLLAAGGAYRRLWDAYETH